jgi:RNA polymerase sigma-70 factor (ECF subfamily)
LLTAIRVACLDKAQIAEYCKQYHDAVFRYIAFRVANQTDAEDLTSEVFLRALNSRDGSVAAPVAWLYSIAENLIIDHYRRRAVRQQAFHEHSEDEPPDAPAPFPDLSQAIDLADALKLLSGEHYQVVLMRFIEGFSLKEVADSLGKTEGAVKALQFRALSKLRGILKEEVHAQS